ncbi:hypothetical protein BO86DRAFT_412727 [Aspergillus japonicus CBS 114.51]|uniref:Uncharacterized protein n=1 Tax=Aspergillus japonicus CBS 114.51 TaxID=1448312 RepID=A0A8T8WRI0_ASPJA|nr:hypothetical protein BO86DRAFT_412727 [Aspergillus japonicus CBS 114.51]RAH77929.1 hypothetical protein BO86DRAFT_412727 [Aspergillus japonicus CBS 114.51]
MALLPSISLLPANLQSPICFPMHAISKALRMALSHHGPLHPTHHRIQVLPTLYQPALTTSPQTRRHTHNPRAFSNLDLDLDPKSKYHRLRLREPEDLVTGFETLLHLLRNPAAAQHGLRKDPEPSNETRALPEADVRNLETAIAQAGFTEGDEPQKLPKILLQDPAGRKMSVTRHFSSFRHALTPSTNRLSPRNSNPWPSTTWASTTPPAPAFSLVPLLRRTTAQAVSPHLPNLRKITFLPDHDSPENAGVHYIPESYFHRIDLVRRLPALKSVAVTLATWNIEAGTPPPPRSANYEEDPLHALADARGGPVLPHRRRQGFADEEYKEAWAEERAALDVRLELPPHDISLMDFPELRRLGAGPHALCFLVRGIGLNR